MLTWRQKLGRPECPYLERWIVDLGKLGSLRLHRWFRSDDKRYPHDHPSNFVTLVLKGRYDDLTPHHCDVKPVTVDGYFRCPRCGKGTVHDGSLAVEHMDPGSIRYRKAEHQHMVSLVGTTGCWTLLYFFPKRRDWGFWVPRKSDGISKFKKSNKYFLEHGHHPCDQP